MEEITNEIKEAKIKIGIVSMFLDIIDDFIADENYQFETKFKANNARKAIEIFQRHLYGVHQEREQLDELKELVVNYAYNIASGEFELKNEKLKIKSKIRKVIIDSLPRVSDELKELYYNDIMKALTKNKFKIVEI